MAKWYIGPARAKDLVEYAQAVIGRYAYQVPYQTYLKIWELVSTEIILWVEERRGPIHPQTGEPIYSQNGYEEYIDWWVNQLVSNAKKTTSENETKVEEKKVSASWISTVFGDKKKRISASRLVAQVPVMPELVSRMEPEIAATAVRMAIQKHAPKIQSIVNEFPIHEYGINQYIEPNMWIAISELVNANVNASNANLTIDALWQFGEFAGTQAIAYLNTMVTAVSNDSYAPSNITRVPYDFTINPEGEYIPRDVRINEPVGGGQWDKLTELIVLVVTDAFTAYVEGAGSEQRAGSEFLDPLNLEPLDLGDWGAGVGGTFIFPDKINIPENYGGTPSEIPPSRGVVKTFGNICDMFGLWATMLSFYIRTAHFEVPYIEAQKKKLKEKYAGVGSYEMSTVNGALVLRDGINGENPREAFISDMADYTGEFFDGVSWSTVANYLP